eukprot:1082928-Alexandrium_andersonii.AAC.1
MPGDGFLRALCTFTQIFDFKLGRCYSGGELLAATGMNVAGLTWPKGASHRRLSKLAGNKMTAPVVGAL